MRCAFLALAPKVGCRSYSSGRAVQRTSSGTPSDQSARCSRKESNASSAQWRSSKTRIVGRASAQDSIARRQAVKDSSCEAGSPPRPDERPQAVLEPCAVGIVRVEAPARSFGCRRVGRVRLEDAALCLDDLPERPEGDPVAVGKAATLAPTDEPGAILDVLEELRAPAGSFPPPARPPASRAGRSAAASERSNVPISTDFSSSRPTSGVGMGAGHIRAEAGSGTRAGGTAPAAPSSPSPRPTPAPRSRRRAPSHGTSARSRRSRSQGRRPAGARRC